MWDEAIAETLVLDDASRKVPAPPLGHMLAHTTKVGFLAA